MYDQNQDWKKMLIIQNMKRATLQYKKHWEYVPLKQGSLEKTWNSTKHNKTIRTILTKNTLKGNETTRQAVYM